jgi:DNA-binding GntR family transcriptional regulator
MVARREAPAARVHIRHELETLLDWMCAVDSPPAEVVLRPLPESPEAADDAYEDAEPAITNAAEQRVYAAVRDAILDHRLAPGTKLKEIPLAELFCVSRATIRNVLARLGHARLAEIRLNRGAVVASPTAAESREIFAARRAIEGAIVASAARAASAKDVADLRELADAERAAYARDERSGLRVSIEFHRRLAAAGRNAVLAHYLEELLLRTPLVALTHRGHLPAGCSSDEHVALIDAIAAHDEAHARTLIEAHLERLESELMRRRPTPAKSLAEVFGAPSPVHEVG